MTNDKLREALSWEVAHQLGYRSDPEAGVIYGLSGRPIATRTSRGYLVLNCRGLGFAVAKLHRLIWESVNGPIPEGLVINHINGIKTDNRICNLEVVTSGENNRHAFAIGLKSNRALMKPVRGRHIESGEVLELDAIDHVVKHGFAASSVYDCIHGRMRSHRGYTWELIK